MSREASKASEDPGETGFGREGVFLGGTISGCMTSAFLPFDRGCDSVSLSMPFRSAGFDARRRWTGKGGWGRGEVESGEWRYWWGDFDEGRGGKGGWVELGGLREGDWVMMWECCGGRVEWKGLGGRGRVERMWKLEGCG